MKTLCLAMCLSLVLQSATWREAAPGYRFEFPRDHASHPEFKLEWWYYTGNVQTAAGRRFGYQVTFFRVGVDPAPLNPSRWAVRDLFMTHLRYRIRSGDAIGSTSVSVAAGPDSPARQRTVIASGTRTGPRRSTRRGGM
jgi:predicted secreted hydrolase